MNRKTVWLLAGLTLLLVLAAQWWSSRNDDDNAVTDSDTSQLIDYALTNFSAEVFNAEGELELTLAAPSLKHYAERRQAEITRPEFQLLQQQSPWNGQAAAGTIDRNHQQLSLSGQVELKQDHPDGVIVLESEFIRYDRERQQLHSPDVARVRQAGTELHGGTLTVWVEEQRAELQNDVQGTYRAAARRPAE